MVFRKQPRVLRAKKEWKALLKTMSFLIVNIILPLVEKLEIVVTSKKTKLTSNFSFSISTLCTLPLCIWISILKILTHYLKV